MKAYQSPFKTAEILALEEVLRTAGFTPFPQRTDYEFTQGKVLWSRRLNDVTPVCRLNDRLSLHLNLHEMRLPGRPELHRSVEVEICGELPDGQWAKLTLYSLPPEQVKDQLVLLEAKVVAAWKAMAALSPAVVE